MKKYLCVKSIVGLSVGKLYEKNDARTILDDDGSQRGLKSNVANNILIPVETFTKNGLEWIKHNGGDCPIPASWVIDVIVNVGFNQYEGHHNAAWHDGKGWPLIISAYRIISTFQDQIENDVIISKDENFCGTVSGADCSTVSDDHNCTSPAESLHGSIQFFDVSPNYQPNNTVYIRCYGSPADAIEPMRTVLTDSHEWPSEYFKKYYLGDFNSDIDVEPDKPIQKIHFKSGGRCQGKTSGLPSSILNSIPESAWNRPKPKPASHDIRELSTQEAAYAAKVAAMQPVPEQPKTFPPRALADFGAPLMLGGGFGK